MTNFDEIQHLASSVATGGISAVPHGRIAALAADAVDRGASPILASVLTDPSAPEVSRIRAFGRVTNVFVGGCVRHLATAA